MADVTYTENLPKDASAQSFQGGVADLGAANEIDGIAGVNRRTQNGKPVVDLSTAVSLTSGAGHRLDEALPASIGQKSSAASMPVVPTNQQFTNPITRIAGDNLSHYLSYAAGATLQALRDTMLSEQSPTYNYGIYNELVAGAVTTGSARRILIAFDLANYALTTIATATLRLRTLTGTAPIAGGSLQAYAIKPANAWVQGGKNADVGDGTDPTWNKRSITPDLDWAGAAGLSTPGTDYDSGSLGTLTWTTDDATWFEMTMAAASLQAIAAANHGFLLIADDETTADKYARFSSLEEAVSNCRPQLVITVSADQIAPARVYLIADGVGATWSNTAVATANSSPIPTSGIEVPYKTNLVGNLAVYVPAGVNVWFAGIGYE